MVPTVFLARTALKRGPGRTPRGSPRPRAPMQQEALSARPGRVRDAPAHLRRHICVVHEALDAERQVRAVGAHQLLQLLALLVQAQQGADLGFCIQLVLSFKFCAKMVH